MFLRLEVLFDLFTHINRLDDGINRSTEIAEAQFRRRASAVPN